MSRTLASNRVLASGRILASTRTLATNRTLVGGSSLLTSLVGYYKFDENTGTSVGDSSSTGAIGTWNGTLGSQWTTGQINSAGNFNGTDNYIDAGNNFNFDNTQAFSVSFWINPTSTSGFWLIFSKNIDPVNHTAKGWSVFNASNVLYLQLNGATSFNVSELQARTGIGIFGAGVWQHFVITYDGSQAGTGVIFYRNGNVTPTGGYDANNLSTSILTTAPFRMGATSAVSPNSFFPGKLDEVGLWSKVLSSTEVSNLYNSGSGLQYPF